MCVSTNTLIAAANDRVEFDLDIYNIYNCNEYIYIYIYIYTYIYMYIYIYENMHIYINTQACCSYTRACWIWVIAIWILIICIHMTYTHIFARTTMLQLHTSVLDLSHYRLDTEQFLALSACLEKNTCVTSLTMIDTSLESDRFLAENTQQLLFTCFVTKNQSFLREFGTNICLEQKTYTLQIIFGTKFAWKHQWHALNNWNVSLSLRIYTWIPVYLYVYMYT